MIWAVGAGAKKHRIGKRSRVLFDPFPSADTVKQSICSSRWHPLHDPVTPFAGFMAITVLSA